MKENNITLLYVEDDIGLRETYIDFFQRRVENIIVAENGRQGLEKFKEFHPDIVVTDIRMPIMDGIEMIREIRKIDKDIPIIVTSAFSEPDYLIQAIDLGVTRYLLKPLQRDNAKFIINETVEYVTLKKHRITREKELQQIIDTQKSIILLTDYDVIQRANQAFYNVTGYENIDVFKDAHKCICELFQDVIKEDYINSKIFSSSMKNGTLLTLTGKKMQMYRNTHQSDGIFLIDIESFVVQDEFVITLTDITELESTKIDLESLNNELVKKVEEIERANFMLEKLTMVDGLTGIANRRMFDETYKNELRKVLRYHKPLALIMIDIDYFKDYNDGYGHGAGDECLIKIANTLQATMHRKYDFVSRYGGEEFIVILYDIDEKGMLNIAQKLKDGIENLNIPHLYSKVTDHVTISIGCAIMIDSNENDATQLMAVTDEMLYKAKSSGRNKICYMDTKQS